MESSSTKVYLVHGTDLNASNSYYKQRPDLTATSRTLSKMTGCLEIIEGEDNGQSKMCQDGTNYGRPSSNTGDRPWSRGSIGSFPPRTDSSMSRRVNTPTKQISLQAVRRKEESAELFVDQVDWQPLTLENNRKIWNSETNAGDSELAKTPALADGFRLEAVVETSWQPTELSEPRKVTGEVTSQTEMTCKDGIVETAKESGVNSREKKGDEKNTDDSDEGDSDDDDDSDSSEEEEEKLRAPNELLMEFVDCLMRKDYQTASKLCKMILLYEPENPEAVKFQPLIEEKLLLDAEAEKEAAEEGSDDDNSEDESEDEDESNDDSDDDDGDSSSDTDSSDEEDDDGSDDDNCDGGNNENGSNSNNNNIIQRSCWQRHLN